MSFSYCTSALRVWERGREKETETCLSSVSTVDDWGSLLQHTKYLGGQVNISFIHSFIEVIWLQYRVYAILCVYSTDI